MIMQLVVVHEMKNGASSDVELEYFDCGLILIFSYNLLMSHDWSLKFSLPKKFRKIFSIKAEGLAHECHNMNCSFQVVLSTLCAALSLHVNLRT
ncbi:hypothetical protein ACS0TY_006043 [Phlomoides rotata]